MNSPVCIVGDIVLDVTLQTPDGMKMRLGGIVHCARALWAMDVPYTIAFFCPAYLKPHIEDFLPRFGNPTMFWLGEITNSPYVILIGEAKETGNQGYEFLLREDIQIKYHEEALRMLRAEKNVLILSGSFEITEVLRNLDHNAMVQVDMANSVSDFEKLGESGLRFNTIFTSTSSEHFQDYYRTAFDFNIKDFFETFNSFASKVVLKENRGGSRAIDFADNKVIQIPAQTQKIQHSVGVGDVYDAIYSTLYTTAGFQGSLNIASWIATEYAKTTYPEDFKKMAVAILNDNPAELVNIDGVVLPWELRSKHNIYIAAPDFDFVDTSLIDTVCDCLSYHNFKPRRPVKENGQMEANASEAEKRMLFAKDMSLLGECTIVVAILLYHDPGTIAEIGIAAERGLPVLVYDPNKIATNCMLTQLPTIVSSDLDEIVSEVFISCAKL